MLKNLSSMALLRHTDIKKQHMNLNNGDNQTKYPDNQINSEHKTSYIQANSAA